MYARSDCDPYLLFWVLGEATVHLAEFKRHHMALLLKLIIHFTFFIIIGRRGSRDAGVGPLHSAFHNEQLVGALSLVQRMHAWQAVGRVLATLVQLVDADVLVEFQDLFLVLEV